MANKSIKQLKPQIRKLYIEDGWEVPRLAESLNRNAKTIYNWVNKEKWAELREENNRKSIKSPEILTKTLEGLIEKVIQTLSSDATPTEIANEVSKITDSISKINKTIKSLYKDNDRLGSVLFVMSDFGNFMRDKSKEQLLPEDFFTNLRSLLEAYQAHALIKYAPGIKN